MLVQELVGTCLCGDGWCIGGERNSIFFVYNSSFL